MSSFGEAYDPICTVFLGASFIDFSIFQNLESGFQIFHIPIPKHVFWGLWTFLDVLACPKIHDFLYNFENYNKGSKLMGCTRGFASRAGLPHPWPSLVMLIPHCALPPRWKLDLGLYWAIFNSSARASQGSVGGLVLVGGG